MNIEQTKHSGKLAIVGASPLGLDSWCSRLIDHLNSHLSINQSRYDVSCFYDYKSDEAPPANSIRQIKLYHLHSLPGQFTKNQFDLILYVIDNSFNSYLYNWFRQSYPGILLLCDASLFHLELAPLMHATDPIGIDSKMRESYPGSNLNLGKAHVLGRSMEIYTSLFPMLDTVDVNQEVLVLENRIAELLRTEGYKVRCLPLVDSIISSHEAVNTNVSQNKPVLVISLTPFSLISKEVRIIAGYESYREVPAPGFFILELDELNQMSSIKEVSLKEVVLRDLGGLILSDVGHRQGTPLIVYDALLNGLRVSLPQSLESDFNKFSGVKFHRRNNSIKEIVDSLNEIKEDYANTLSPKLFDSFFSYLEELSISINKLRVEKVDARRLSLTYKLEKILKDSATIEHELGIKHDIKSDLEELFAHEKA